MLERGIMYDNYDPKTSLGFYSHVSSHPVATWESGRMIRKYHPNAPIFLSLDGNADLEQYRYTAIMLGAEWMVNKATMGYPVQPYGYQREKVLEWFKRLYIGFAKMDVSHVMMWEEDSLFLGPVEFDENWGMACHNIQVGNEIHPGVLTLIQDFSDKKPKTKRYGSGGCSIFKREPLLEHYHEIYKWLDGNLDWIQNSFYPQLGWMDCLMTVVYMLCGEDYHVNPQLYNLDPHSSEELLLSKASPEIVGEKFKNTPYTIIHNYKHWY